MEIEVQGNFTNSDDTIFRDSHSEKVNLKFFFCKIHRKKPVSESLFGGRNNILLKAGKNKIDMICYVPIRNIYTKFGSVIFWIKENEV